MCYTLGIHAQSTYVGQRRRLADPARQGTCRLSSRPPRGGTDRPITTPVPILGEAATAVPMLRRLRRWLGSSPSDSCGSSSLNSHLGFNSGGRPDPRPAPPATIPAALSTRGLTVTREAPRRGQDPPGRRRLRRPRPVPGRRHRPLRLRQVDPAARPDRLPPRRLRRGPLRRPRTVRRVLPAAPPHRPGPAGRRPARPAHREGRPPLRRRPPLPPGHHRRAARAPHRRGPDRPAPDRVRGQQGQRLCPAASASASPSPWSC